MASVESTLKATSERLDQIKATLKFYGITSVSSLPPLTIKENVVVPIGLCTAHTAIQGGAHPVQGRRVRVPELKTGETLTSKTFDHIKFRWVTTQAPHLGSLSPQARMQQIQAGARTPQAGGMLAAGINAPQIAGAVALVSANQLTLTTAYLAGSVINIPDNTVIVLAQEIRNLVIVADQLTIGQNVLLTYEPLADPQLPSTPVKPPTPGEPPGVSNNSFEKGRTGYQGVNALAGAHGTSMSDRHAPFVEIWTLNANQLPFMDLRGQDGGAGGRGGDGGDGGPGSRGSNGVTSGPARINCKRGPGDGGNGGHGGRAGDGGDGGSGGPGGRLRVYSTPAVLQQLSPAVLTSGGSGGAGGPGGSPGRGGNGGPPGDWGGRSCEVSNKRHQGAPGATGAAGKAGSPGPAGPLGDPVPVAMVPISQNDYFQHLSNPVISSLSPHVATVGSSVTLLGANLEPTDTVEVNHVPAPATYVSSTVMTFVVPPVQGGQLDVCVKQVSGTLSNLGTLFVRPMIDPASVPHRIVPGTTVAFNGSGFSPHCRLRVNNEDQSSVQFINQGQVKAVVERPSNVEHNSTGEHVSISIVDGTLHSDPVNTVLDTYRIAVLGDSIAWGEGLSKEKKFSYKVAADRQNKTPKIGVYCEEGDVKAHCSATLGWSDSGVGPEWPGEVPARYPTVRQQAQKLKLVAPETVKLILVTASINDVGLSSLFAAVPKDQHIKERVHQYCYLDMKSFLADTCTSFLNARVIVPNYFAPVSNQSITQWYVPMMKWAMNTSDPWNALGLIIPRPAEFECVVHNCKVFYEESSKALRQAVNETAQSFGSSRVAFADPGFGPENAGGARKEWLWTLKLIAAGEIMGSDEVKQVREIRENLCNSYTKGFDCEYCKRAAAGHPNEAGADAYANAIIALL